MICAPPDPGSAIVNSGSVTGLLGNSTIIDYTMTKGGIHSLTRALSGSLASRHIRVNAVAPGPVWTPLNPNKNPKAMAGFGRQHPHKAPGPAGGNRPRLPLPRLRTDVSYITGEILPVIGGYTDR